MDFASYMWLSCNKHCALTLNSDRKFPMTNSASEDREQGQVFMPKFDAAGLLTAVAVNVVDGSVLMLAHMDAEALAMTRETGFAHFHSRSRGRLWMKGESSGHVLKVQEILVDCDQDAIVLRCVPHGPACHTLALTCFYRRLEGNELVHLLLSAP